MEEWHVRASFKKGYMKFELNKKIINLVPKIRLLFFKYIVSNRPCIEINVFRLIGNYKKNMKFDSFMTYRH